jgi:hypothetical protein
MATNPYSYGSLGARWTVGEPTSKSLLDISRVKNDANRWVLEQLLTDPDDSTTGFGLLNGVTATTQSPSDNSTKVATTAYADAAASASATPPGGANTQIQYNNNGAFGASSNLTFDGSTLTVVGSIDSDNPLVMQTTTSYQSNATGDGTVATVQFNNSVVDRGSDFSSSTTFTAPEAGYYQVSSVVGLAFSAAPTTASMQVVASNRSLEIARVNPSTMGYPGGTVLCLGGSVLIDMDAADTLTITMTCFGTTKTVGFDVAPRQWLTIFKTA